MFYCGCAIVVPRMKATADDESRAGKKTKTTSTIYKMKTYTRNSNCIQTKPHIHRVRVSERANETPTHTQCFLVRHFRVLFLLFFCDLAILSVTIQCESLSLSLSAVCSLFFVNCFPQKFYCCVFLLLCFLLSLYLSLKCFCFFAFVYLDLNISKIVCFYFQSIWNCKAQNVF